MAPLCPNPWLPLKISAPAPGPNVQLLLLLLLLVPTHPQSLSRMQGGDSSGEEDPVSEEDLPREEDLPGEDTPGMKPETEEDSLKVEDLPTPAPSDTHRNKGKWSSALRI